MTKAEADQLVKEVSLGINSKDLIDLIDSMVTDNRVHGIIESFRLLTEETWNSETELADGIQRLADMMEKANKN